MKYSALLPCLALPVCFPLAGFAAPYPATVDRVVDGDTLVASWDGHDRYPIRVVGIDTPEVVAQNRPVECFGQEASDYAQTLLWEGALVSLDFENEYDKYDRALGYITLEDGTDFGYQMIRNGYAYAYRTYPHDRMNRYTQAEYYARTNEHGLWATDTCRDSEQSREQISLARQSYIDTLAQLIRLVLSMLM